MVHPRRRVWRRHRRRVSRRQLKVGGDRHGTLPSASREAPRPLRRGAPSASRSLSGCDPARRSTIALSFVSPHCVGGLQRRYRVPRVAVNPSQLDGSSGCMGLVGSVGRAGVRVPPHGRPFRECLVAELAASECPSLARQGWRTSVHSPRSIARWSLRSLAADTVTGHAGVWPLFSRNIAGVMTTSSSAHLPCWRRTMRPVAMLSRSARRTSVRISRVSFETLSTTARSLVFRCPVSARIAFLSSDLSIRLVAVTPRSFFSSRPSEARVVVLRWSAASPLRCRRGSGCCGGRPCTAPR